MLSRGARLVRLLRERGVLPSDDEVVLYDPDPTGEVERRRQARIARLERELRPLFAEIRTAGVDVSGLEELGVVANYPDERIARLAPILAAWLPRIEDDGVRWLLVMALTAEQTRDAAPEATEVLLREFTNTDNHESYRWSVANALLGRRDERERATYRRLVCEPTYGRPREPLIELIGIRATAEDVELLGRLLDDQEVDDVALRTLRRLRSKRARELAQAAAARGIVERPDDEDEDEDEEE